MHDDYEEYDSPVHEESGEFFLKRYRELCPDVALVDGKELRQALRVNTLKVDAKDLIAALSRREVSIEKIPFLRNGYWVSASFSLGSTPEYLLGQYYLQGPLSQLACEMLDPENHMTVLDLAAAPGGKTTYLAQMAFDGYVVALDSNPTRLAAVRNNVERLGLPNVICVKKDARFAVDLKEEFDRVLLDAPCSGNFCSERGWMAKRTIADIRKNARMQKELLKAAIACTKPGGRILYSTCSLEPEEDECVISWALRRYEHLSVVPLSTTIGDAGTVRWNNEELDPRVAETRRFWPHKTGCEGFFIALLEKKD